MESLKIIAGCVLAAILYGIVHDQFTARICLEYFAIFHPPIFSTQSPTLLAIGWGIIATWWVGVPLGVLLAISARAGSHPTLRFSQLVRPISVLLLIMGCCAFVSGIIGYASGEIPEFIKNELPASLYRRFATDLWAHNASYLSGSVGGLVLCVITYWKRGRLGLSSAASIDNSVVLNRE
jgi:hypothetical protein